MVNAMPGMSGLPPQAPAEMRPEDIAAFEQMRQEVSPSEFNTDVLSTAFEADPVTVAEFRSELEGLNLPPEALDMLNMMVDEILASPQDYQQISDKYRAQDVPEELLPPVFDPEFFGALNLALDYIRTDEGTPMPPMGFARGGIASLNPLTEAIQREGRYGDTMLAHISPREAQMLRSRGGSGSINPVTGLPEFFIKKLFKGVGKALKKVGRAVKKFAKSSVGRIVTTMALAFFLGPAAAGALGISSTAGVAAVSGFVGSSGSTLAAGGSPKDALRAGAVGGLTAGATAGVFGGADAFQAGSYTGPTTIGGQVDRAREFFTGAPAEAAQPLPDMGTVPAADIGTVPPIDTGATTFPLEAQTPITRQGIGGLPDEATRFREFTADMGPDAAGLSQQAAPQRIIGTQGDGTPFTQAQFDRSMGLMADARPAVPSAPPAPVTQAAGQRPLNLGRFGEGRSMFGFEQGTPDALSAQTRAATDTLTGGDKNIFQRGLDKILPSRIQETGAADALKQTRAAFPELSEFQITTAPETSVVGKFYASKLPGPISMYGPIAATGLGIMALGGGFKEEEIDPPAGFEDFMAGPAMQDQDSRIRYGGVMTQAMSPQYNPYTYAPAQPVRGAAKGGSMDKEFPRKTGPINGPGTGTSDDIPAMLSDGEFVFTAKAVRGMGEGSRRAGAKKMYALMKKLEGRANG